MNAQENLLNLASQYVAAKDNGKETRKNLGSQIAEAVKEAVTNGSPEDTAWIEANTGKDKPLNSVKSFVSKGFRVGNAIKSNKIKAGNESVSTLYDKLLEIEKQEEQAQAVVSARSARTIEALRLACDGDMSQVNRLLTLGEADVEYKTALANGMAVIAEAEAKAEATEKASNAEALTTEIKASITALIETGRADLVDEIKAFFHTEKQKMKQAA